VVNVNDYDNPVKLMLTSSNIQRRMKIKEINNEDNIVFQLLLLISLRIFEKEAWEELWEWINGCASTTESVFVAIECVFARWKSRIATLCTS